ncbi:MAG: DUF433 domain-containing protein [Alphaproteobacteria bacterium]|nr:DUF433 domain-containing protein [Alphaproteobacteria bacterium]
MNWQNFIVRDPAICKGRPTVKGTRILVSVVLDNLADGRTPAQIAESYPPLKEEQIAACLGYAAWLSHEETIALPEPA